MQTEQLRTSNYILEDFRFNPGKITWEIRFSFNPLKSELIAQQIQNPKTIYKEDHYGWNISIIQIQISEWISFL